MEPMKRKRVKVIDDWDFSKEFSRDVCVRALRTYVILICRPLGPDSICYTETNENKNQQYEVDVTVNDQDERRHPQNSSLEVITLFAFRQFLTEGKEAAEAVPENLGYKESKHVDYVDFDLNFFRFLAFPPATEHAQLLDEVNDHYDGVANQKQ